MSTSTAVAERPQGGNAVANVRPAEAVRAALEKMKPQIARALPRHITPDRLLRVAMTAIQNTPKLLDCDRTSLYAAIMTCAQLGLEPDGVLGQAYLVPFKGRVQFIPGYKGLISLARNSGDVTSIEAHEVREKDAFDFAFGLNARCEHVPARGDRGEIEYFYAIARFKDGGHHWDVMTRAEVEIIRNRSSGWQAAVANQKKYGGEIKSPWNTDFAEMGKKTVIRRIAKYLPMSVQKAAAIADAYDSGKHGALDVHGDLVIEGSADEAIDESHQIERKESKLDRFESEGGQVDDETGEVRESATESPASSRHPDDAPSGSTAAATPETVAAAPAGSASAGERSATVAETGRQPEGDLLGGKPAPAKAKPAGKPPNSPLKGGNWAAFTPWFVGQIKTLPLAEISEFLATYSAECDAMAGERLDEWMQVEDAQDQRKKAGR